MSVNPTMRSLTWRTPLIILICGCLIGMIAFEDEAPLARLIAAIEAANNDIKRASDHIRLFQVPLDRIV